MAFDLGAGLAAAGATVATQAGNEALELQKSDLESQRDQLAASTAHGFKSQEIQQTGDIATAAAAQQHQYKSDELIQESGLSVTAQQQIAQNAADLTKTLGSDPTYLAAQKALNATDPLKQAQAADAMSQAALANQQTAAAKAVMTARQSIIDEQSKPGGGDPATLAKLNSNFSTLLTDPAAAAAMRTAAVANARVNEDAAARAATDLNAATAKLQDFGTSGDPAARAALQANVDNLSQRVHTLNAAADDAIKTANGYFSGPAIPGSKGVINTPAPGTTPPKAAPEPLPAKQTDLQTNHTYTTSRGPAIWNGTQFIPAPAVSTP